MIRSTSSKVQILVRAPVRVLYVPLRLTELRGLGRTVDASGKC